MAASSAYASAATTVMTPVITQTSRSAPGPQADTWRPMSAETMKIPDPIMEPTTSEIAASGPMPRMNSGDWLAGAGAFAGATTQLPVLDWVLAAALDLEGVSAAFTASSTTACPAAARPFMTL